MKLRIDISDNEYNELVRTLKGIANRADAFTALVLEHHVTALAIAAANPIRSHSHIARYTRRMMEDLQRDGFTIRSVTYGDARESSRQRNRMYNAGRHLGLKITTTSQRCSILDHEPGCPDMTITGRIVGGDGTVRPPVGGTK